MARAFQPVMSVCLSNPTGWKACATPLRLPRPSVKENSPDILIVGQGLAGTMLGWELERAGISFAITDRGHANAATVAGAGLVNPITGRRLVKSWRIEALLPLARTAYRAMGDALGVSLWHEMRVRRFFADERERVVFAGKQEREELAPFVAQADEVGFWIRDAARVDLAALLSRSQSRWRESGTLKIGEIELAAELRRHALVIDCRGQAGADTGEFDFIPWEFSKGERIEIAIEGLAPDLILNRRQWIAPVAAGVAWAGATHEPGVRDVAPSASARNLLEAAARDLLGPERLFTVTGHRAGVRVNLPDKHPVAGRHPSVKRLGLINGLGAKGAVWAPLLAREWMRHLIDGAPFDPEIDVRRFR